jgi:murein DD-endopeptidase MepM/ murein hydrolase activator NlpD
VRRRGLLFAIRRALVRFVLSIGVAAPIMLGMVDGFAPQRAIADRGSFTAGAAASAPTWTIDVDNDGVPDFANPTRNVVRGEDRYGSGAFGAERDDGRRVHEGADFIAAPASSVYAPLSGVVTKMGFAYGNDRHLRFVEVTDAPMRLVARIFYVDPSIGLGQAVTAGDAIGVAQSLARRYPRGITNHVHVEISDGQGFMFDPGKILPPAEAAPMFAALAIDPSPPGSDPARS